MFFFLTGHVLLLGAFRIQSKADRSTEQKLIWFSREENFLGCYGCPLCFLSQSQFHFLCSCPRKLSLPHQDKQIVPQKLKSGKDLRVSIYLGSTLTTYFLKFKDNILIKQCMFIADKQKKTGKENKYQKLSEREFGVHPLPLYTYLSLFKEEIIPGHTL